MRPPVDGHGSTFSHRYLFATRCSRAPGDVFGECSMYQRPARCASFAWGSDTHACAPHNFSAFVRVIGPFGRAESRVDGILRTHPHTVIRSGDLVRCVWVNIPSQPDYCSLLVPLDYRIWHSPFCALRRPLRRGIGRRIIDHHTTSR